MKRALIGILSVLLLPAGSALYAENDKLAQAGFHFLSVVSDARASGMAEAMASLQIGSSALFFNPAGMANLGCLLEASASTNEWIADIRHNTLSMAVSPVDGRWGVLGFSMHSVDYGDFLGTRVDKSSDMGYRDTGKFRLSALAVGAGYAKSLTDRFSVGGQVRWVHQDLGESIVPRIAVVSDSLGQTRLDTTEQKTVNELKPFSFDFGTQFKTGIKSLVFGMSVRNFSKEIKYVEEGFQLPLLFTLGISMDVMDFWEQQPFQQSLIVSVDACHHRDHPEQIKVGADYRLMNLLSLRLGYISSSDESGLTFGIGMTRYGLTFDYAYTPYGVFDRVQRMTARIRF